MKKMTRFLALILALSMLSTVAVGAEKSDAPAAVIPGAVKIKAAALGVQ